MGDVINLRLARKVKRREEKEAKAAENRVRFGLTKAERGSAEADRSRVARHLDGHLLDGAPEETERAP